jgi:hypothetical protein
MRRRRALVLFLAEGHGGAFTLNVEIETGGVEFDEALVFDADVAKLKRPLQLAELFAVALPHGNSGAGPIQINSPYKFRPRW